MISSALHPPVHGFYDIEWDDYRLPAHIWKGICRTKYDRAAIDVKLECWLWCGAKDVNAKMVMVKYLRPTLQRDQILALVPTCGHTTCCRPSHLCLTVRDN